jgi:peptidoglycan/LPS O-acetylase OafA/YrhL
VLSSGNLAVDFFFVLSGFVIQLSWSGRVGDGRFREFFLARFARIYPLHLLMLAGFAAYYAAAIIFGDATLKEQDPYYLLLSLLLVQNWGFTAETTWNVPAWSISAETAAYLLFPILLSALRPCSRPTWLLGLLLVAVSVFVHGFFAYFSFPFPDAIAQTGLVRCLAQFAMGMIVAELYRRYQAEVRLSRYLVAAAICLAWAWSAVAAPLMPLAWAALTWGLALYRGNLFAAAPLVWLGRISYATYLSHYFILMLFKFAFLQQGETFTPLVAAAYMVAVLVASAILYYGVERPAQRLLLHWFGGRRSAVSQAAA